jgi:hypothetical protein
MAYINQFLTTGRGLIQANCETFYNLLLENYLWTNCADADIANHAKRMLQDISGFTLDNPPVEITAPIDPHKTELDGYIDLSKPGVQGQLIMSELENVRYHLDSLKWSAGYTKALYRIAQPMDKLATKLQSTIAVLRDDLYLPRPLTWVHSGMTHYPLADAIGV